MPKVVIASDKALVKLSAYAKVDLANSANFTSHLAVFSLNRQARFFQFVHSIEVIVSDDDDNVTKSFARVTRETMSIIHSSDITYLDSGSLPARVVKMIDERGTPLENSSAEGGLSPQSKADVSAASSKAEQPKQRQNLRPGRRERLAKDKVVAKTPTDKAIGNIIDKFVAAIPASAPKEQDTVSATSSEKRKRLSHSQRVARARERGKAASLTVKPTPPAEQKEDLGELDDKVEEVEVKREKPETDAPLLVEKVVEPKIDPSVYFKSLLEKAKPAGKFGVSIAPKSSVVVDVPLKVEPTLKEIEAVEADPAKLLERVSTPPTERKTRDLKSAFAE